MGRLYSVVYLKGLMIRLRVEEWGDIHTLTPIFLEKMVVIHTIEKFFANVVFRSLIWKR